MRKFEVGKRYGEHAVVFEIISRTEKTVTFQAVHHPGRFNEIKKSPKKAKISNWNTREVFFANDETVEA